jgi:DinB family protein
VVEFQERENLSCQKPESEANMTASSANYVTHAYHRTHDRVLTLAEKMSDAQLAWQPTPTTLPIAFHLWHLARWADHLQAAMPGMTAELGRRLGSGAEKWEAHGLAGRWGFDSDTLGHAETGMGMSDSVAVQLTFPAKDIVLDYVRQVFTAADRAMRAIDEQQFQAEEQPQPMTHGVWEDGSTVGNAIIAHLTHDNRHLGMIECLYGLQVESGTATI